jgi:arabinose-5-phosphate isomerase
MMDNVTPDASSDVELARRVLKTEADGLMELAKSLDGTFSAALNLFAETTGRIIVTGMGKSGHVAHKVAATLASTGKPAFFVHPAEASHGDLGMIEKGDSVLAFSNSGETPELSDIVAYTRRYKIPLIVVTGKSGSSLVEQSDVALILPPAEEACPIGMAPTTSTTMQMALGDALAVALMERRGFTADDFKDRHPGGQLGKMLLKVSDIMHSGHHLPLTSATENMSHALLEMTSKSLGCIAIVDDAGMLEGVITDGDLRRHMSDDLTRKNAGDVMTKNPTSIRPGALASEAVQVMNDKNITNLFVTLENQVVGIIHIHDCLRAGVV